MSKKLTLEKRVEQFMLLELAGKEQMLPAGTFNLVWDLLRELLQRKAEVKLLRDKLDLMSK